MKELKKTGDTQIITCKELEKIVKTMSQKEKDDFLEQFIKSNNKVID